MRICTCYGLVEQKTRLVVWLNWPALTCIVSGGALNSNHSITHLSELESR